MYFYAISLYLVHTLTKEFESLKFLALTLFVLLAYIGVGVILVSLGPRPKQIFMDEIAARVQSGNKFARNLIILNNWGVNPRKYKYFDSSSIDPKND